MEVLSKIRDKLPEMTPLQRKVGHFITDHIDKVAFMSISELAQLNGVSDATVFKFTKLLGYDGYIDFTKDIQKNVYSRLSRIDEAASNRAQPTTSVTITLHDRIIKKEIDNLSAFNDMLHADDIDKCVEKMIHADCISVVGMMSASAIGHLYAHMLMQLFDDVTHISNLDVYAYSALNRLTVQSVVFMLALPRYPMIIGDLSRSLNKKKVFQIGVTNTLDAPLANYADVIVKTPFELSSLQRSVTAPLAFLNIIIAGLLDKSPDKFASKLQRYDKYFTDFYTLMHKF